MKTKFRFYPGLIVILALLELIFLSCSGHDVSGPEDATDLDAIYRLVTIDETDEFNIDLLDFSIPDTSAPNIIAYDQLFYWFDLSTDSLDLQISLDYPGSHDSLGTLPEAAVQMIKKFYGTLEIIGVDTVNGSEVPVRISRPFVIRGEVSAYFVKYGPDYSHRRGWLMREISDVVYLAGYPEGITQIMINSDSYSSFILTPGLKTLSEIPSFAPGESVMVIVNGSNIDDKFRLRYPEGGVFQNILLENDGQGNFIGEFRMPQTGERNHFLIEAIGETSFRVSGQFRYEAVGVIFRTE